MIYKFKNFSFQNPKCEDGDVFEYCNLTQLSPMTVICEGIAKLTFRSCNLLNCKIPDDAVVDDCLTAQVDKCTNLHSELVEQGLKKCSEDCKHKIGVTKQSIIIPKEDYISAKAASPLSVSASTITDANGIITQTFTKQTYGYRDTVLGKDMKEATK